MDDASVLSETGGSLTLPDGQVLTYATADLETDTVALTSPLPVALNAGDQVLVYPLAPTRVATVHSEDGKVITARVPQSLLDETPTGLRDAVEAETVVLDIVDSVWQITDLLSVPTRTLDPSVVAGIEERLDAVPVPHTSTSAPTVVDVMPAGTRWEQIDTAGRVIGIWSQTQEPTGSAWATRELELSVLRTTLRFEAEREAIFGPDGGTQVRIQDGRVDVTQIVDGEPQPYISMGKGADGAFRVLDGDQGVPGGVMPDGSYEGPEARVESLEVDGRALPDWLGPKVESLGQFFTPRGVTYGPYTVDMPLVEVSVDVPANHTLTLNARGWMRGTAGDVGLLRCSYTTASSGTPSRPTGSSTELLPYAPVVYESSWRAVSWSWTLGVGSTDTRVRMLVWTFRDGGVNPSARDFVVTPTIAAIRGAAGFAGVVRATPGGGGGDTNPPPSIVERTRRFDLGPHALWIRTLHPTSGYRLGDVQIGRSASGQLFDTAILLPTAARNFISTAEELVSARVRLSQSVYPTTIRPSIGTVTSTNITGSRPSSRNTWPGSRTYTPGTPSGWTALDSRTLTALSAGDPGLWLPSQGGQIGRFHGPSAGAAVRPQIEITTRSRT